MTLPESSDQFFQDFHKAAHTAEYVTLDDLKRNLVLLREAYKAYPDRRPRIEAMATVLKVGIKACEGRSLKDDVRNALG